MSTHMFRPDLRAVFLALPVVLVACGSVPTRTFEFSAMDTHQNPVPALVVVGDDWASAVEHNQLVNVKKSDDVLPLKIPFERGEVSVTVVPVKADENGKLLVVPRSRQDTSEYVIDVPRGANPRLLRLTDPTRQMFILMKKVEG